MPIRTAPVVSTNWNLISISSDLFFTSVTIYRQRAKHITGVQKGRKLINIRCLKSSKFDWHNFFCFV